MTLPIRTLPVVEQWDCHACGRCCRGTIIPLNDEELERIRQQRWGEHPDYRGLRIFKRNGLWQRRYRLAHRSDGTCVFLTPENRCLIHEQHGEAAKPFICRMFPFQLVPLERFAYLTLRRHCPSAAADNGRRLEEHLPSVRRLAEERQPAAKPAGPPEVTPGDRRPWKDTLRVTEVIERLLLDPRYPPVRRLVHGLEFCRLLETCRLRRLDGGRFGQLLSMLESSAVEEAGELFSSRRPPGRGAGGFFRQAALEYLQLHGKYTPEKSWRARLRLVRLAIAFTRGKGRVPHIHPGFPQTTFEDLERPLGHLEAGVLGPLGKYFETAAASKQYAFLGKQKWSIVESFRALALAYPIAMWLLRLTCAGREPTVEDMVDAVGAIDRGQSYAPLCGRRHRQRVKVLARLNELPRLVAWYAR